MPETVPTILIIANSPEDRSLFRRYLSQRREPVYELVEEAGGSQGLSAGWGRRSMPESKQVTGKNQPRNM